MISSNYTPDYFNEGNEVIYVPKHALEEFARWLQRDTPEWMLKYSQFQKGIVSSINEKYVFVKYGNLSELKTSIATDPKDLLLWKK